MIVGNTAGNGNTSPPDHRHPRLVAGVELGGTKIVCTLASGPDRVVAMERFATTDPNSALDAVTAVLNRWTGAHPVEAIGIGSFGPVELDPRSDRFGRITATTKAGWRDTDVLGRVAGRYGLPAGLDTDVNAAALAEGRWGAAQGLHAWTYITVGTGVGAGIVLAGRTARGQDHPEAGHMLVRRPPGHDWPGVCTFHGDCVEGLVSGPAIERRVGLPGAQIPDDHPVWHEVADVLAAMVHNLVLTVAPQRILIGGGVPSSRVALLPMVRERLAISLGGYGATDELTARLDTVVVAPGLGDRAGPLGSIAVALDAWERDRAPTCVAPSVAMTEPPPLRRTAANRQTEAGEAS